MAAVVVGFVVAVVASVVVTVVAAVVCSVVVTVVVVVCVVVVASVVVLCSAVWDSVGSFETVEISVRSPFLLSSFDVQPVIINEDAKVNILASSATDFR